MKTTLLIIAVAALSLLAPTASAGITVDGSLVSRQVLAGPTYALTQAHAALRDTNKFLSLEELSLADGDNGTVGLPSGVSNVYIRVTGGEPAVFDGPLTFDYGVDVTLISPAGFEVRANPGAGGRLLLTTADEVAFGDDSFGTRDLDGTLSSDGPTAFRAVESDGSILWENLEYISPENGRLALMGSGIRIVGSRMVADPGNMLFYAVGTGFSVTPSDGHFEREGPLADIQITDGAYLEVNGGTHHFSFNTMTVDDSGVNTESGRRGMPAGVLQLAGNVIGLVKGSIVTRGYGMVPPTLEILVDTFTATDDSRLAVLSDTDASRLSIRSSGDLTITDSAVRTVTEGTNSGPEIEIDGVTVELNDSVVESLTEEGVGTPIGIVGQDITLTGSTMVVGQGSLDSADYMVTINATRLLRVADQLDGNSAELSAHGTGEVAVRHVFVDTDRLELEDATLHLIGAGPTVTPLQITAQTVEMMSSHLRSVPTGDGQPSVSLHIDADNLTMTDSTITVIDTNIVGGELNIAITDTFAMSQGEVAAVGEVGDAGRLVVAAAYLSLAGATLASRAETGSALGISLNVDDTLLTKNGARFEVVGHGEQASGGIHSLAGNVIGLIDAEASIVVTDTIDANTSAFFSAPTVLLQDSAISVDVPPNEDVGIEVDAGTFSVRNDSELSTCSADPERSNDILLVAHVSLAFAAPDSGDEIAIRTCNNTTGDAGDIMIDTPVVTISSPPLFDLSAEGGLTGALRFYDGDEAEPTRLLFLDELDPNETACEDNAQRLQQGLDDGEPGGTAQDGVLDPAEVDAEATLCEDASHQNFVVRTDEEEPGDNCEAGGVRLDSGTDAGGREGILDADEVSSTVFLCNDGQIAGDAPEAADMADPDVSDTDSADVDAVADPDESESVDSEAEGDEVLQPDAGVDETPEDDAQADSGSEQTTETDTGCGCATAERRLPPSLVFALFVVVVGSRRRRCS